MVSSLAWIMLSVICIVSGDFDIIEKKYSHAHELQDLEAYQAPSSIQTNNINKVYYVSTPPSTGYNNNPYLFRPNTAQQSSYQPQTNIPSQNIQTSPNVIPVAPVSSPVVPTSVSPIQAQVSHNVPVQTPPPAPVQNNGYTNQNPIPITNNYGPHLYSAPVSQYSGPQITYNDLQNNPVLIVVKNPNTLSYDVAYASSGLSNLDRDTNSQLTARLLLQHADKVGIVYPTNGFPINSYPDFPINKLILPEDMGLSKIFNFYPRYIPILFLMNSKGYQKVARETTLNHLGQYKYE